MSHVIEEPRDRTRLLEILGADRVRNAYPIGAAAPGYADQVRFFWALKHGQPQAIITVYHGLSVPALFTWGDVESLSLLFSRVVRQLPERTLLHRYPKHAPAYQKRIVPAGRRRVVRMSLVKKDFEPAKIEISPVGLSHGDTADIQSLYTNYPDSFFEPYQLETGFYRGIREGEKLVSVAGVHLVSPELSFAMLGNIVTAPASQGRGYAGQLTSVTCQALFDVADLLVLDVPLETSNAVSVFDRLGFKVQFRYDQVLVRLRR